MTIDIIIPTLNSAATLESCLASIVSQQCKSKINLLVIDGGSTDNTIKIAKKYHCQILHNPRKTAEAAKAVGIYHSTGDYIALIDSDNILPSSDWLEQMLLPFKNHPDLIGSEPYSFTYRPEAGFIERYCSLIGANDPYTFVIGVSDRNNLIDHRWCHLPLRIKSFPEYQIFTIKPNQLIPTIGANGTVYRSSFLKDNFKGDYLFDIDIITQVANRGVTIQFAKVKVGIIHIYCGSDISKFIRKQKRRLIDFYIYRQYRHYDWSSSNRTGIIKFSLYTLLIIPPIIDSIRGYINQPDSAWFFHLPACLITFYLYSTITISSLLGQLRPVNRQKWSQ